MAKQLLISFDIGGTKCSVSIGIDPTNPIDTKAISTEINVHPGKFIESLIDLAISLLHKNGFSIKDVCGVGVVCGGPVDEAEGYILSPPNLPGWNSIDILSPIRKKLCKNALLQNDANASVVAEWNFGAGRTLRNLVFLTYGTGMGAGIIVNDDLFSGAHGMAGEVGRMVLCGELTGFGQIKDTFENLCSGGGIARLANNLITQGYTSYSQLGLEEYSISAESLFRSANNGNQYAKEIIKFSSRVLASGVKSIIDIVDPDILILGSIFVRSSNLILPCLLEELKCSDGILQYENVPIVPAQLGIKLGDISGLLLALKAKEQ